MLSCFHTAPRLGGSARRWGREEGGEGGKEHPVLPPHAAEGLSRAGIQQVYLFLQLQDHRWDSGQSLGIFKPALRGMKAPP